MRFTPEFRCREILGQLASRSSFRPFTPLAVMKRHIQPLRPLLDAIQAAERLGISGRSFQRLVKAKKIRRIFVGMRSVRFCPNEIECYINSRTEGGEA